MIFCIPAVGPKQCPLTDQLKGQPKVGWWVGAEIGVIEEKIKRSFNEIENKWLVLEEISLGK